jgi:hypothetical protein
MLLILATPDMVVGRSVPSFEPQSPRLILLSNGFYAPLAMAIPPLCDWA